jgi:hypothetical protein
MKRSILAGLVDEKVIAEMNDAVSMEIAAGSSAGPSTNRASTQPELFLLLSRSLIRSGIMAYQSKNAV